MLEIAVVSFATFFATIGPLDIGIIFAAISVKENQKNKKHIAFKSFLIANVIFLVFALLGELILKSLGISLVSLKIGGGILLLLTAIDLVFAKASGATTTTTEEKEEAISRDDIAIFPLSTPLIAGPGTLGALVLLISAQKGDLVAQVIIFLSLIFVVFIALLCMLLSQQIQKIFGISGMQAISRIFGIILAALAVEFILDGIRQANLFTI